MPPKQKPSTQEPSTQEPSTTGELEPSGADEESLRIAGLGYEEARDELLDVVRRLETGGTPLEESLTLWERGEALADRCQTILDGARARLDAARSGADDE